MIDLEEFKKIELTLGLVEKIDKDYIKITSNKKQFVTKIKLNVKEGDKIVVAFDNSNIFIPVVAGNIPLKPEKDIELGSKIM